MMLSLTSSVLSWERVLSASIKTKPIGELAGSFTLLIATNTWVFSSNAGA